MAEQLEQLNSVNGLSRNERAFTLDIHLHNKYVIMHRLYTVGCRLNHCAVIQNHKVYVPNKYGPKTMFDDSL